MVADFFTGDVKLSLLEKVRQETEDLFPKDSELKYPHNPHDRQNKPNQKNNLHNLYQFNFNISIPVQKRIFKMFIPELQEVCSSQDPHELHAEFSL